ncbi:MAG TPA: hypothetical protein VFS18_04190 [Actinomycetota bacterium]|nr:hypothetical protein [Actinomycetota bacterium]
MLSLMLAATLVPARAQTPPACTTGDTSTPERFGPTDIQAVSGNQRLSVALNGSATVTVFKWPSPSYYDQIKYTTSDRSSPRMGAMPNDGALIGIAWRRTRNEGPRWGFSWLRKWPSRQSFLDDDSDVVVTRFERKSLGLSVRVRDVVPPSVNALVREVKVTRTRGTGIRKVRVVAFANFNPVISKLRQAPVADWCTEGSNDEGAAYVRREDVIVHQRAGVDESTNLPSSVALALGFAGRSEAHHVGTDTYETPSDGTSAYDDAGDGRLRGGDQAPGQADAAMFDQLGLGNSRSKTTRVLMAAAATPDDVMNVVRSARSQGTSAFIREKARWWRNWLKKSALPEDAPGRVRRLSKRALISIRQATDRKSGLISASISTQSPLGLDWVRNGAYINRALHLARHPEMAKKHNERYAELQATAGQRPPGGETTPAGNWSENFYADGVVGGPTSYEIDATGLGIWTLWDHYDRTGDVTYLTSAKVYEAIQRAAHYLTDDPPLGCRDPATGLQCTANEDGGDDPSRTLKGAQAAWLGLGAAVKAARVYARVKNSPIAEQNADRWADRRDELRAAIDTNYFDQDCKCYTQDHQTGGTLLWPVGLVAKGTVRSDSQAERNWRHIKRAINGKEEQGSLEARALVGNAFAATGGRSLRRVKRGLRWVASVPTTNRTGLLGAAWMLYPPGDDQKRRITTMVGQPHVWHQAMFYLASVRAYGRERWTAR